MSIRGIIDGTISFSGEDNPIIQDITVSSTSSPIVSIPLTFIKNGLLCTMFIGPFNSSTTTNIIIDMSDPSISQFLPTNSPFYSNILINNGSINQFAILSWDTGTSLMTINTIDTTTSIGITEIQSINYITQ